MIGFPFVAEFVGESLSHVAVTGHAVAPEEIAALFELGGIFGERRLGEGIVGRRWGGRGGLRPDGDGMDCGQSDDNESEQGDGEDGFDFHGGNFYRGS